MSNEHLYQKEPCTEVKTLGKYPGTNTKLHIQAKQSALAFVGGYNNDT